MHRWAGPLHWWRVAPLSLLVAVLLLSPAGRACYIGDVAAYVQAVAQPAAGQVSKKLVVAAFLRARGVAPGSPGFSWRRVQYRAVAGDVTADPGEELAVAGTILPEDGFVVVFARSSGGDGYQARYVADNLARIDALRVVDVTPAQARGGPRTLAATHSYNEMSGAFFRWERLTYLRWEDGVFHIVLDVPLYDESYSLEPLLAIRLLQEQTVLQETAAGVRLHCRNRRWDKQSDGGYRLAADEQFFRLYQWDEAGFNLKPDAR